MAKAALARLDEGKRSAIFAVAAEEFARRGFYGASVEEIARRAQIAKGAVYLYFDSKLDLFKDTLREGARRLEGLFEATLAAADSFPERLHFLYRSAAAAVAQAAAPWRMYCDLVNTNDPDLVPMAAELEASSSRFYRRLVADGQRRGEVRRDLPVPVLAYLLDNTFVQFFAAAVSGYQAERLRVFWPEAVDAAAALAGEQEAVLEFLRAAVAPPCNETGNGSEPEEEQP